MRIILLNVFLYVLFIQTETTPVVPSNETVKSADEIFEFCNAAQNKLKLSENPNIILVIGNTGSGKSTLVHYVAGDYSQIESKKPANSETEYQIIDKLDVDFGKIPTSSTKSRTIIPEMVVDEQKNTWYDSPGFEDTRSPIIEISTTYLIRTVIENASKIKIVLVVDSDSVTDTHSRSDLDKLLKHATTLMKNVQLFRNSVSLVVTKVKSSYIVDDEIKRLTDDAVKSSVVKFMLNHRAVLQQSTTDKAINDKIDLIDALTVQSTDCNYCKVSTFWRPAKSGPLNKIDRMIDARAKIRKSILEKTSFVSIDQNDFGFPLTANTKQKIESMARHTFEQISTILTDIDDQLYNGLRLQFESINGIYEKIKWISNYNQTFFDHTDSSITLSQWTYQIKNIINIFDKSAIDMDEFDRIEQSVENVYILKVISDSKIELPVLNFISNSSKAIQFLNSEKYWYSSISQTIEFLSSYPIQKDVSIHESLMNIPKWNKSNGKSSVAENSFVAFIYQFLNNKNIIQTPLKSLELNEIIDATLKTTTQYECDGDTLTISGNYVKSSDIKVPANCSSSKITKINVYVVATFFVDCDLNFNGFEQLNILAYKWHILRNATFHLNGFNGEPHKISMEKGHAGEPGNPGMNGGDFFGVAQKIIDGDKLIIQQNGGNGGSGQNGTRSDDITLPKEVDDLFEIRRKASSVDATTNITSLLIKQTSGYHYCSGYFYLYHLNYTFDKCCGPTGMGGSGGLGGYSGTYELLRINGEDKTSSPLSKSENGLIGADGSSAEPCKSIKFKRSYSYHTTCSVCSWSSEWYPIINENCTYRSVKNSNISKGVDKIPTNHIPIVIEYDQFLVKKLKHLPFLEMIRDTWISLDTKLNITAYTKNDFIVKTNILEDNFYKLHSNVHLLPFYENVLKNLADYRTSKAKISKEDEQMLSLLQLTILSKMNSMKNGYESDQIIFIEKYLETLVQNIREYNNAGNELEKKTLNLRRFQTIDELRDKYAGKIQLKIDEANDFIVKDIGPAIIELFEMLDIEMQLTVNDTIAFQSCGFENATYTSENAKFIKKLSMKRMALTTINKVSKFLKLIPFVGSALVNLTAVDIETSSINYPPNLRQLQNLLASDDKKIFESVEKELNSLIRSMKMIKDSKRVLTKKLEEFSETANRIKLSGSFDHNDVRGLLKNLMSFVNSEAYENFAVKGAVKRILKKAANALAWIASSEKYYHQLSDNVKIRDEVGKEINEDRDSLYSLMAFDDRIYSKLLPIEDFINEIQMNTEVDLKKKSLIALKLEIPNDLRSIKKIIKKMMTNFFNDGELKHCLMDIIQAIDIMLDIYDRIQNYQKHEQFVELMSKFYAIDNDENVATPSVNQTVEIDQFESKLKANIIFAQYHRVIDGFKQSVFPFASDYSNAYQLPKTLSPTQMTSFISFFGDKINALIKHVTELNMSDTTKSGATIYKAYFERTSIETNGPFFTWPISDIREKIRKLFAGEKVYLLADVRQMNKWNAIKFTSIYLNFNTINETINDQFKNVLKSFHISLTHTGESNYRCDNKIFTIYNRPLTIEFSFSQKANESPVVSSVSYDMLSKGLAVLSPYTLWGVQLKRGDFEKLKLFVDYVTNIDLQGNGQYLENDVAICKTNLEEFYTRKQF